MMPGWKLGWNGEWLIMVDKFSITMGIDGIILIGE
jgi:hypothetical protein